MANLADLVARARTEGVDTATVQLKALGQAGHVAEDGVSAAAAAARGLGGPMVALNDNIRQQKATLDQARRSMGLNTQEGLNMGRQLSDVGVQLAMGMSPFMIAIQQGPQIFDVLQQAAIRSGTSIRAAMVATGTAVWTALAPLLPVIAAIGIAGGTLAAAWGLASRSIRNDIGSVADEMELSAHQVEYLEKKQVQMTVTAGDVWRGLGTTIGNMFDDVFGAKVDWVSERWNSFLDDLTSNTGKEVDAIAGFFSGAYLVVVNTWRQLPAALGDAAYSAANASIGALNWLLQKSVDAIDFLRRKYNELPAFLRGGQEAPLIGSAYQIDPLGNPYAGAMDRLDAGNLAAFQRGYNSRQGMSGRFMDDWRQNSLASAKSRVQDGLENYKEPAGDVAKETEKIVESLRAIERVDLDPLRAHLDKVLTPLQEMQIELEMITDLTNRLADGMGSAFGRGGGAAGEMLSSLAAYRERLNGYREREDWLNTNAAGNEQAMAEHRLKMSQDQIATYGDMARAARGFFDENSSGYQALLIIEQLFRAQQLAGMLMAIATGSTETAASVANSATRGTASMAAGAARMFEALGPWGFPAVAAMVGLLAGMGLRGGGGGGSSRGYAANDNTPGGAATEAVRAQSAQSDARRVAASALGQQIEVKVTADRDGLNAFVVRTAEDTARPLVAQGMAAASGATRSQVMYDLDKQATYGRRS